jgi:hypothetical protein
LGKLRGSQLADEEVHNPPAEAKPRDPRPTSTPLMRLLLILLLFLLAGCRTTSESLRNMYTNSLNERLNGSDFYTLSEQYIERQETRLEFVRGFVREGKLVTAEDYLYAGALLSTSGFKDDLIAASASGLTAAEMGEDLGFRVAAEAIDKLKMHLGDPQRYGTQYYYVEVIQQWRLYPVDPATTDEERIAMGVLPLAELMAQAELLNEEVR